MIWGKHRRELIIAQETIKMMKRDVGRLQATIHRDQAAYAVFQKTIGHLEDKIKRLEAHLDHLNYDDEVPL